MVPLVQMLEILNIKVIWMLMHFVIAYRYTINAHYARFLMISIAVGMPILNDNLKHPGERVNCSPSISLPLFLSPRLLRFMLFSKYTYTIGTLILTANRAPGIFRIRN